MSSAKFASITAGLLARKGEAQAWNQLGRDRARTTRAVLARPLARSRHPSAAAAGQGQVLFGAHVGA